MTNIGKFRRNVDLSNEYKKIADQDEKSAIILASAGNYRNAIYFAIQSMEKNIRSKVFTIVNPNIDFFIQKNRNHSLESAVDFLIEISTTDDLIKNQISDQLKINVLGSTNYSHIHNNLRYPNYSAKFNSYSMLDVVKEDYDLVMRRLELLKSFLKDIHRIS